MANATELSLPVTINDLLDAGLHFGHQSKRWNPKMKRFIFDKRAGIYIIDLAKSLAQLQLAQRFVYESAARGKNVLFVGTKKPCQGILKEAALRCGQHYVISRWLGGTLTNHKNISNSIRRLRTIEEQEKSGALDSMPQKEASRLRHELARLQRNLSGLVNLNNMPGVMIVVDINREAIAVKEANRMNIPVVAVVDTNCDPDPIQYPIPGNDDSSRAIKLIVNIMADTIIKANSDFAEVRAQEAAAAAAAAKEKPPAEHGAEQRPRMRRDKGDRERRPRAKTSGGRSAGRAAPAAKEAGEKPAATPAADAAAPEKPQANA